MPSTDQPKDESERQSVLRSLNILDTPPEAVFDRVTRLAARLLNVPISFFSIIDSERQWFKSRVGVDASQTPREHAICAHTILSSSPLVIEDALKDERFNENPYVINAPHVRFYAGVPVRSSSGIAIGTLCAIDTAPRKISLEDLQTLEDLADIVSKELQYRERLGLAHESLVRTDAAAMESESRFRSVFELASIGIALVAPNGTWIRVNSALCQIVGYTEAELHRLTFQDITYPDDLDNDLHLLELLHKGHIEQYQLEKRYIRKNGSIVWIQLNVSRKVNDDNDVEYYISAIKDIDAQKAAEIAIKKMNAELEERVRGRTHELQSSNSMLTAAMIRQMRTERQLREREAELSSVIENANDAYIALDETGKITEWNKQAEMTFGWTRAEAVGIPLSQLIIPNEYVDAHERGLCNFLATGHSSVLNKRLELPGKRKDGNSLMLEVRISSQKVNERHMFNAFLHDISDRKLEQERREYESSHDPLTGLFNRRALLEQLPIAQKRALRNNSIIALLFIDLDGFKAVNDTWGHEAGDNLLKNIAVRLNKTLRETDTVFRFAGDEFAVLLENIKLDNDPAIVAEKLISVISEPMVIGTASAQVGASIGIALQARGKIEQSELLLREADQWMYKAKRAGRGQVRWAP